jgi:hypothetical protein
MHPFQEPSREQALQMQQSQTHEGKVTYERGLDLKEITGYFVISSDFVVVFGDFATPVLEQQRVMIPTRRVIELVCDTP